MYMFGLAPWEWRDVEETWRPIVDSESGPEPGLALDVGCGSGRDAVYLAKRGWRVTAIDFSEEALAITKVIGCCSVRVQARRGSRCSCGFALRDDTTARSSSAVGDLHATRDTDLEPDAAGSCSVGSNRKRRGHPAPGS
jgi:SAM-dependent methyltransferase